MVYGTKRGVCWEHSHFPLKFVFVFVFGSAFYVKILGDLVRKVRFTVLVYYHDLFEIVIYKTFHKLLEQLILFL